MNSKILIDVDEVGSSTIRIERPNYDSGAIDVRDKLVSRFLEGGVFCAITWDDKSSFIHSMNALDVLDNILNIYGQSMKPELLKEFEQAVFKVCSIIEQFKGERSSKFEELAAAQSIVKG